MLVLNKGVKWLRTTVGGTGTCSGMKPEMVCAEENAPEKISVNWIEMKVCDGNSISETACWL
jgi:Ni,Fe-hydrogenase I small subunit